MLVSPTSKIERRRLAFRQEARDLLQDLADGKADPYLAYRRLYALWCANNAALQELRPLFRIDRIEPDGRLSITDEFRKLALSTAKTVLPTFSV